MDCTEATSTAAFSAAERRGLIEASAAERGMEEWPEFSAAERRGLIEAAMAIGNRNDFRDVFRGRTPRPH